MRILMLVAVSFAFILRLSAAQAQQCGTVAECEAQRVFAQSELRRFARETAEVKGTEVALAKTETAMSWTPTPTKTATPTVTSTSTATPTPTSTATPGPTQTAVMVIINVVQTVPPVQAQATPVGAKTGSTSTTIAIVITLIVLLAAGGVILFRPQVYMLSHRERRNHDQ